MAIARAWWVLVVAGPILAVLSIAAAYHDASRGDFGPVLRDPASIAIGPAEEIVVFTDWGRIRVFDRTGAQVRSWPVQTGQGGALLAFDPDGVLQIATHRNDMLYRFDIGGKLLSQQQKPGAAEELPISSTWSAQGPSGDLYKIRGRAIVRIRSTGKEEVVVPGPPGWAPDFLFDLHPLLFLPTALLLPLGGVVLRSLRKGAAA